MNEDLGKKAEEVKEKSFKLVFKGGLVPIILKQKHISDPQSDDDGADQRISVITIVYRS